MKTKTLTLFTCALMLAVFSIPVVTHNSFPPIIASSPKVDSSSWKVQVDNATSFSLTRTANESYLYVGGTMLTGTTWNYTLWKYTSSGVNLWNTTTSISGYTSNGFSKLALSPDEGAIYAVGVILNGSQYNGILVKFNATDGSYLWNYTLSGPSYNNLYGVAVSPDGSKVYTSGQLSQSGGGGEYYDISFYVAALNSSTGSKIWDYVLYEANGWGLSQDVAVSPTRDEVYAVGIYFTSGVDITLVALNATDGTPLWNINSTTYSYPIYSVDVSSDGNTIYAMAPLGISNSFLTINATDGSVLGNMNLTGASYPCAFDFSPDKTKIFATAYYISTGFMPQYLLATEYDFFTGTLTGVIKAPDHNTYAYGVVASSDNKSVYVAGEYADSSDEVYRMFLLKGQPEPLYSQLQLLPLLFMILSQNPTIFNSTNSVLLGIGIASALAVASFLIVIIVKGRHAEKI